jgi:PhnB protein
MPVKPIPDGYHSLTPYLVVNGAAAAIEFYKKAFGATERFRMPGPDGRIGHAELQFGNSAIMLADECPERGARGPKSIGGSPISLYLYMENVDAVIDRAVSAGATLKQPVVNQFYGDRSGGVEDPFGHVWYVATHIEDVSPEEMQKRMAAMKPK